MSTPQQPPQPTNVGVTMGMSQNNESNIRSESNKYNEGTRSKQLIHEEYNSGRNLAPILDRIKAGNARDLSEEPKHAGQPVIILASGPSLDDAMPLLHQWEGGVICTPSHALSLMRWGCEPTHIVALDPFESWTHLEGVDWSKTRTKLITHPGVWPDLIEHWPNEMLLYRQDLAKPDSYYATTQRHMYSERVGGRERADFNILIRTMITVFACSPPCQLYAADRLGYGVPFLVGADFGWNIGGKDRFTEYTIKQPERTIATGNAAPITIEPQWEAHEHWLAPVSPDAREQDHWVTANNGMVTTTIHLFYKKNVISAWRLYGKTIVNTSRAGIITEMPTMDIADVIKHQGKCKLWSPRKVKQVAEQYLASVGAYVLEVKTGKGCNFVESKNPEVDLHGFMVKMNRQYSCSTCGIQAEANDANEHEGDECPQCKQGKLTHKHLFDIGENMKKIRRLMPLADVTKTDAK